jgi:hypothetical protein
MNKKICAALFYASVLAFSGSAIAGFVDARTEPAAPAAKPAEAEKAAPVAEAKPAAPAPKPMAALDVKKTISAQMFTLAEAAGWRLIWDAPDFKLDVPVNVSSDFMEAIMAVIDSANTAGARLRADFYRGNKIVRVTEL